MSNSITFLDNVITASIKRGYLTQGKRLDCLLSWWKKMSANEDTEEALASMPAVELFAPAVITIGSAEPVEPKQNETQRIYLSPLMELAPKSQVIHTIAHEFSHVYLGHTRTTSVNYVEGLAHEQQPNELAADALAASWGFPKNKRAGRWITTILIGHAKSIRSGRTQQEFIAAAFGPDVAREVRKAARRKRCP